MRTKVLRAEEAIAMIASEKQRADEKAARKVRQGSEGVTADGRRDDHHRRGQPHG